MTKYRIVKRIFTNNNKETTEYFIIQKYKRFLGIGPKYWQSFEGCQGWEQEPQWTIFLDAKYYDTYEKALVVLNEIIPSKKEDIVIYTTEI